KASKKCLFRKIGNAGAIGTTPGQPNNLITNEYGQPASPLSLTPVLVESQIQRLSEAAELLVKSLPPMDPKLANNKKRISKELECIAF
ncbi:NGFI-A-binding protein 1-like protein, partial [Leptotrombidium deliense]